MCLSARGLPSYHNVAILAGTETHRQDRIAESNPAMRHSDCDNRTTTQDVQLRSWLVCVPNIYAGVSASNPNTAVMRWEAKTPCIES